MVVSNHRIYHREASHHVFDCEYGSYVEGSNANDFCLKREYLQAPVGIWKLYSDHTDSFPAVRYKISNPST